MKFIRALFVCIVIESISSSAFSQTIDKKAEPKLGPIVPLGSLAFDYDFQVSVVKEPVLGPIVLIASLDEIEVPAPREITREHAQNVPASEVSVVPHPGYGTMRIISRPSAAPTPESHYPAYPLPVAGLPYPAATLPQPIAILPHPDEIQFQLACIANQLMAAHLPAEAAKIQEFQRTFQRDHYQQLLISFKESQIHVLQSEIEGLKKDYQSEFAPNFVAAVALEHQICMHFCVVELNKTDADRLFSNSISKDFDSDQIRDSVSELCRAGAAKIVAEPNSTVFNGQPFVVRFKPSFDDVPAFSPIFPVGSRMVIEDCGLSLYVTPTCLDSSNIRVGLTVEHTMREELKVANANGASDSNSVPQTTRLKTIGDLSKGRTLGVMFTPLSTDSKDANSGSEKLLLILVTPEVVRANELPDSSVPVYHPAAIYHPDAVEVKPANQR